MSTNNSNIAATVVADEKASEVIQSVYGGGKTVVELGEETSGILFEKFQEFLRSPYDTNKKVGVRTSSIPEYDEIESLVNSGKDVAIKFYSDEDNFFISDLISTVAMSDGLSRKEFNFNLSIGFLGLNISIIFGKRSNTVSDPYYITLQGFIINLD